MPGSLSQPKETSSLFIQLECITHLGSLGASEYSQCRFPAVIQVVAHLGIRKNKNGSCAPFLARDSKTSKYFGHLHQEQMNGKLCAAFMDPLRADYSPPPPPPIKTKECLCASIDREKMFVDLSPVKRCLCWLSPLVSRLHLAQTNQNTNTPLSFGCSPSPPPALPHCHSISD